MKTIIIDNYDSFTHIIYQYIAELGGNPKVIKNNELSLEEISKENPSHIIISPGPGRPEKKEDFGVCEEVIKKLSPSTPLLGVCLGHQGIIHAFGGSIDHAPTIMHGKKSLVTHDNSRLFKGIPTPFAVMRYHSLIACQENFPHKSLKITATTEKENLIMAVEHKEYPLFGIQFHPESIGTPEGKQILKNFLNIKRV